MRQTVDRLTALYGRAIERVVGIESRGFIFAGAAYLLGAVPVRKAGSSRASSGSTPWNTAPTPWRCTGTRSSRGRGADRGRRAGHRGHRAGHGAPGGEPGGRGGRDGVCGRADSSTGASTWGTTTWSPWSRTEGRSLRSHERAQDGAVAGTGGHRGRPRGMADRPDPPPWRRSLCAAPATRRWRRRSAPCRSGRRRSGSARRWGWPWRRRGPRRARRRSPVPGGGRTRAAATRPTAVNLFWGIERMRRVAQEAGAAAERGAERGAQRGDLPVLEVRRRLVQEALRIARGAAAGSGSTERRCLVRGTGC